MTEGHLNDIRSRLRGSRRFIAEDRRDLLDVDTMADDIEALVAEVVRLRSAVATSGQQAALILLSAESVLGESLLGRSSGAVTPNKQPASSPAPSPPRGAGR